MRDFGWKELSRRAMMLLVFEAVGSATASFCVCHMLVWFLLSIQCRRPGADLKGLDAKLNLLLQGAG